MKRIIKSTIGILIVQLPLWAAELPNRLGGKFGTISTNVTIKKMYGSQKSSSCIPIMTVRMKLHTSNYLGIYVKHVVISYTNITKCGQPYRAQQLWSELYLRYDGSYTPYFKRICGKEAFNLSYFRVRCTHSGWLYDLADGKAGNFAASVDGYQLQKNLYKGK